MGWLCWLLINLILRIIWWLWSCSTTFSVFIILTCWKWSWCWKSGYMYFSSVCLHKAQPFLLFIHAGTGFWIAGMIINQNLNNLYIDDTNVLTFSFRLQLPKEGSLPLNTSVQDSSRPLYVPNRAETEQRKRLYNNCCIFEIHHYI